MLTLSLQNIIYTTLNSRTWCATAQIASPLLSLTYNCPTSSKPLAPFTPLSCLTKLYSHAFYQLDNNINSLLSARQIAQNRRRQQRKGVRLLLQLLLVKIGITETLDESQFPYRLSNSGYYVCFSHSGGVDIASSQLTDKVAVIISADRAVGIDIEIQDIAWQVAQRFYHPAEIEILADLAIYQRNIIVRWLWQLKESFIKIYQYKLAQGLGMSYAEIIPKLIASLNEDYSTDTVISNTRNGYQITVLPCQQTVVVF